MQNETKTNRQDQKQNHRERDQRAGDPALSQVGKSRRVIAGSLITEKTISNAAIKSIRAERYHQRREFDAGNQIPIE